MTLLDQNNFNTEPEVPFLPEALKCGALLAGISSLVFLLPNVLGLVVPGSVMSSSVLGIGSLLALIFVLRSGMLAHKFGKLGGNISFKRAFLFALVVVALSSLVAGLVQMFYVLVIDPSYAETAVESTLDLIESMGADSSAADEQLADMEDQFSFVGLLKNILLGTFLFAPILSLFAAWFIKKRPAVKF